MNIFDLFHNIISFIIIAIIISLYVRVSKYNEVKIKFNNIKLSTVSAIVAIVISILLTGIYDIYFTNIFPINSIYNFFIVKFMLCIPAIIAMIINKESIESIGFTNINLIKSIIIGFITGLLFFFTSDIKSFTIVKHINQQNAKILGDLFLMNLIVGFSEEFLYRGYLQTRIIHWIGQKKGWILTSIIFAFIHLEQRVIIDKLQLGQALTSCVILLPMSLLLGYVMLKTKNTTSCAILHAFFNFTYTIISYI